MIENTKANRELRESMKGAGLAMWQVAVQLGIAEGTLCRWLRVKVTPDRHKAIESAIKKAKKAQKMIDKGA